MKRLWLAVLSIVLSGGMVQAGPMTGAEIKAQIESFLVNTGIAAIPKMSDSRLYYPCETKLMIAPRLPQRWDALDVSCETPIPWSIIVRTTGQKWTNGAPPDDNASAGNDGMVAVVLSHAARRDQVITGDMLELKKFDSQPAEGYFTDPEKLIGRRMKRQLGAGVPIRSRHLEMQWTISAGDRVMLEHNQGGLFVAMMGVALEDGQSGDMIRVKNSSSGRVLHGFVSDRNKITVLSNMN